MDALSAQAASKRRKELHSKVSYKRLDGAKFKWRVISDGVMRLSPGRLSALFEGLDWRRVYAPRIRRPQLAG